MRYQVIGAGLMGLAVVEALVQRGLPCILQDQGEVAAGASGAAAGLLHPLPTWRGQAPWQAERAFRLVRTHLQSLQQVDPTLVVAQGIWMPQPSEEACQHRLTQSWGVPCPAPPLQLPWMVQGPGLWVAEGMVIDTPRYLGAWLHSLLERGVEWRPHLPWDPNAEQPKDVVTIECTGAALSQSQPQYWRLVRGQSLLIRLPEPPPWGVLGRAYLAPHPLGTVLGATYEHDRIDLQPDPERALQLLQHRIGPILRKALEPAQILATFVGTRCTTAQRLPSILRLAPRRWCAGGLGSKGLLHHLLVGHCAAEEVLSVEAGFDGAASEWAPARQELRAGAVHARR